MESPPKRMTRARAAAKASDGTVKTTKIVTAAARAKSTATASTKSTAAKRKTRADEHEEDEEDQREVPAVRRRGRPKKADEPAEATAPPKVTRVRATRKIAADAPKEEPVVAKPTRGRPKKVVAEAPAEESAPEPAKKTTTRARSTTTSRTTTVRALTTKKSVKFQEPDKENIEPAVGAREPVRAGLRGRPAKRGGAAGSRTTRAAVRTATTDTKPLSPKKITQIAVSKDDSEDELAGESTLIKPMMRHPIKPPSTKRIEPAAAEEQTEETETNQILDPPSLAAGLVSPAKRLPASPPPKDTMKSPARRIGAVPLPGSTMKPTGSITDGANVPSFKASLLQSAAKRPPSPIKGLHIGGASTSQYPQSAMKPSLLLSPAKRAHPGIVPCTEPRHLDRAAIGDVPIMKPFTLSTPTRANARPSDKLMMEDQSEGLEDPFTGPIESLQFPGRLSAVLPRHADPAWKKDMGIVDKPGEQEEQGEAVGAAEAAEAESEEVDAVEPVMEEPIEAVQEEDSMVVDEEAAEQEEIAEEVENAENSPPQSPESGNPIYQLRDKDLDPLHDMDSESEDEQEARPEAVPITPTPFARKTPKTQGSKTKSSRASIGGFTALAERFGSWSAASPIKMAPLASSEAGRATPSVQASPHYFDDEMTVRFNAEAAVEGQESEAVDVSFDDIMATEEDVALAQEANEMSLMGPQMFEGAGGDAFDDSLSEASQEYGNENELPVDPAMGQSHFSVPITPVRPVMKSFNTTTKVPLKPADDSTPSSLKKRSFTASRVAPQRPTGSNRKSLPVTNVELASAPTTPGPVTPSKADLWSSMGTPARTPRRDVNPALLRGAVVFVDVHTSEGADASSIFVELLTQMGAKCLKSWTWNPTGAGEVSSSKVGITHVVYKDGGKRTLEKVRQTNGVVQCVGVSWVLDCERENEWLDEAPYYINTKVIPRGGARRRKSMEPKALANMNGTLVHSPVKGSRRASGTPITPKNRRESATWEYTPSEQDDEDMDDDPDWSNLMLTPVPKTPAPDAIARYAANLGPETPGDDDEDDLDESPTKESLMTRTCPPKRPLYHGISIASPSPEKDDQVLLRLMAARRKSLQFAPKIGSPLARAWK
ncbi:hypothetical protein BGZ63DRAFT_407394 [Mariannaea sp. PMI_226]|nr:hypothetical protein BGZ63DRAFT_407394 [Mariannaea sp. PMI_226]